MRQIDHNTRFVTLIGKPLGQSFSARMQNAGYAAAGLNLFYFYSETEPEQLEDVLRGVRAMPFAGCAVTKPYKVAVMRYLDDCDPLCRKMGSSNTVVKTAEGKLTGYNTDGYGALRSLREEGVAPEGQTFLCFGAGGTGRSVCFELANAGAKRITICSRSESCETLCGELDAFYPGVCVPLRAADAAGVARAMAESAVVLNLTGCGMLGKEDETPVDGRLFRPEQVCYDATYNPAVTRFLREAAEAGCRTINGLDMLIYQGVRQIELWTGVSPTEAMRAEVNAILAEGS